jgi:L-ascorbate metabolism protein UlaG (beta-lactamase superfamily)
VSKRLKIAAGVVLLPPALLVLAWYVYSSHSPYEIAARDRPPPHLSAADGGVSIRFLGVTGYEITDGTTVVLVDPTPTRPTPTELITGPLAVDEAHGKQVCPKADFIFVNHTHFDHALDVPAIALRTGARVLGSESTLNYARSRGVPEEKLQRVKAGDHLTLGTFTVDVRKARHAAVMGFDEPWSGTMAGATGPFWFWEITTDETLFLRLESNGTSVWFHPTSTFASGEIGGPPAGTLIVGVTGEKQTPDKVQGLLAEAKPRLVFPTHFDNFYHPMQKGLGLMPFLDLDGARELFLKAQPDLAWVVLDYGQTVHLPPDVVAPGT